MKDPELIPAVYGSGAHARGSGAVSSAHTAASATSDDSQHAPKKRKAWVVADWKGRLPGSAVVKESNAARRLRLKQAAEERKEQLACEYADLYATIDGILQRCDGITQTYGSKNQQKQRDQSGPTVLTMRSCAPGTRRPGTAPAMSAPVVASAAVARAESSARQQVQQWKAPVDLNPGMNFRPGTPQRIVATAPELPAVMARIAALSDDIKRLDMTHLTHRERLQAGIQVLNGEFYAALKECGRTPGHHSASSMLPTCAN